MFGGEGLYEGLKRAWRYRVKGYRLHDIRHTVGTALRSMCARRQWHLPIVCSRGLFLGALDIADISLWLRDRLTFLSVDAAFGGLEAVL